MEAVHGARDGRAPELVIVFSADRLAGEELLDGVAEAARGARVIGCSVPGDIGPEGPGHDGVLVLVLGGGGMAFDTAATTYGHGPGAAGALIAERLACGGEHAGRELVMLLGGATAGEQGEIVRGFEAVLGEATPLAGGFSGRYPSRCGTRQFHGTSALADGVVGVSLRSERPLGIGVAHGLSRVGEAMVVTRSDGARLLELDGRPALDVYLERLEAPAAVMADAEAFADFALAHPLELGRRRGLAQTRPVCEANYEERSLRCGAPLPQGGLVWPMGATVASTVASAEAACEEAVRALHGAAARALVVFDCIGRRRLLGEAGARAEADALRGAANGAALAGFYTHGEIARMGGASGVHDTLLVALAIA
jgi:hypothetical protein